MTQFRNNPTLTDSKEGMVKRYVHQPLTVEHYGIHAKIQENGTVLISSGVSANTDGTETFDEIEIHNQLVFEIASLLKATRSVSTSGTEKRKQYTHQPLTIERYRVTVSIKENGKILLTSPDRLVVGSKDTYEYDEVEISASLIFKLATLLKATRSVKYVSASQSLITENE